jgi:NADH-quinone oxidoreductase subunit N
MIYYLLHNHLLFKQELLLLLGILILLLTQIFGGKQHTVWTLQWVNLLLLIIVLAGFWPLGYNSAFRNMYQLTSLNAFEKSVLAFAAYIISMQGYNWLQRFEHTYEFYVLVLSSLIGMLCMLSSTNFLFFYIGLELSTLPLALLVNFQLNRKQSSEAAFKFIMSAAFASAILLLGISFLYGLSGSLNFNAVAEKLILNPFSLVTILLFLAGVLFKVSVVPFHLWTADVYEGAPISVTAFLSVVSKASLLFVLLNLSFMVFYHLQSVWHIVMIILLLVTIVIGNIYALRQENFKRFMDFSSIKQIGFILVAFLGNAYNASTAVVYFLVIYLFSNLVVIGVITYVENAFDIQNINEFKGLYKKNKFLSWVLLIGLFSLAGIPPTAGFFGKFFLIMSGSENLHYIPWITLAAVNLIISLYYYLRVAIVVFDNNVEFDAPTIAIPQPIKLSFIICIVGILITGVGSWIYHYIYSHTAAAF